MVKEKNSELLLDELRDMALLSVNDGILLGMRGSLKSLNQLIEAKKNKKFQELITKDELNNFMNETIRLNEKKFKEVELKLKNK